MAAGLAPPVEAAGAGIGLDAPAAGGVAVLAASWVVAGLAFFDLDLATFLGAVAVVAGGVWPLAAWAFAGGAWPAGGWPDTAWRASASSLDSKRPASFSVSSLAAAGGIWPTIWDKAAGFILAAIGRRTESSSSASRSAASRGRILE